MSDNGAEQHRFTRTALLICGGLLIWAAHFLFVYVAAAIICARYAQATLASMPLVTFVTAAATALACAATLMLLWFASRRARDDSETDASVRFIYSLTSAIGALALVAIVFSAIPGLLLATECGPIKGFTAETAEIAEWRLSFSDLYLRSLWLIVFPHRSASEL